MDICTNVSIKGDLNVTTPSAQLLDSLSLRGANITSTSNLNLGSTSGWVISVTGNTTVTSFGNAAAGVVRYLLFNSILTLTHNNTSLVLPYGVNITTQIGDSATVVSLGNSNWKVVNYQSITPLVSAVSVNSYRKHFLLMGA